MSNRHKEEEQDLSPVPMTMTVQSTISFGHARALPAADAPAKPHIIAIRPVLPEGNGVRPVMLPESESPQQAASDHLQPVMGIAYQRTPLSSLTGVFTVTLSLHNLSGHVAHEPFLCLPLLGLELAAAPGLNSEEVSSVRRLRRFSAVMGESLQPGAALHCCNILLAYDARDGGVIQYDFGTWHKVADLPDLKLTCVAGAGNFPSERLPIVVPATILKGFFVSLIRSGEIEEPAAAM